MADESMYSDTSCHLTYLDALRIAALLVAEAVRSRMLAVVEAKLVRGQSVVLLRA